MKALPIIMAMTMFLATASCDKVTEPQGEFGNNKILKMRYSDNDETSFDYTGADLTKLTIKEDNQTTVINLVYNAEKKVSELRYDDGTVYKLGYVDGLVTKLDMFDDQNDRYGFMEISYEGGFVREMTSFIKRADPGAYPPVLRITYSYFPGGKGNVQTATYKAWVDALNDYEPLKTIEYDEYDDKVSPITHLRFIGYLFYGMNSANNPKKVIEKDKNGAVVSTRTTTYTYRPSGLPQSASINVFENGQTTNEQILYIY